MFNYLRRHPQIFMPAAKEPHYFAQDLSAPGFVKDERTYLAFFSGAGQAKRVGEASVWYLYSGVAAARIHAFQPDARIIVMLRDPVEMIRSLHGRSLFSRDETITDLAAALDAEADRREGRRIPAGAALPAALLYRDAARFSAQVARFIGRFGPERVHFVILEDLAADPGDVYGGVLEFLGVDASFRPEFGVVNAHRRPRSELANRLVFDTSWGARAISRRVLPPRWRQRARSTLVWRRFIRLNADSTRPTAMAPDLRLRLQRELAPDVASLSDRLGRDMALLWWGQRAGDLTMAAGGRGAGSVAPDPRRTAP
ncbi:hypothetical protein BH20CHL6_BH20CHL6_04860 [soil metagenome]